MTNKVKFTIAREAEDSMVAYLGKQRGRRTQKETKHKEKHFIIASTSVPPTMFPPQLNTYKYPTSQHIIYRNKLISKKNIKKRTIIIK